MIKISGRAKSFLTVAIIFSGSGILATLELGDQPYMRTSILVLAVSSLYLLARLPTRRENTGKEDTTNREKELEDHQ